MIDRILNWIESHEWLDNFADGAIVALMFAAFFVAYILSGAQS